MQRSSLLLVILEGVLVIQHLQRTTARLVVSKRTVSSLPRHSPFLPNPIPKRPTNQHIAIPMPPVLTSQHAGIINITAY
ncbi:hypothetical protein VTJ04DRAFT_3972 [Mycothermus thermophilus]|uniref:uncharacterized protein n=1 Tax=Humicola insolens TaxID=85995 RepID=UPI0037426379